MALVSWLIPLFVAGALLWWYFHVPRSIPRGLPRVPLYAAFIEIWYNMGHLEVYDRWMREPMEKHGAVVMWTSGYWHVLVGRPEFLTEMFRQHDIYQKAGNQVRVPNTVIGKWVGDNMINSTARNWELYSSVMKTGIQKSFEPEFFQRKARTLVHRFVQEYKTATGSSKTGVPVAPLMQQFAVDGMAQAFYDLDLQSLEKPVAMEQTLTQLKPMVFGMLYRHLPFLDKLSWILPWRRRAFALVAEYEEALCGMAGEIGHGKQEKQSNVAARLLQDAFEEGKLTPYQYRSNLKLLFLSGHETIQSLLMCAMWELGSNTTIQDRLRAEVLEVSRTSTSIADTLNTLPYLASVTFELLRLYPPLASLPNRVNTVPVHLGQEIPLAAGTWLGWSAYAVQTNPRIWGPRAGAFSPERWGNTISEIQANVRRETVRGAYIPFIAHTRKCPAQKFALMQIKVALLELVRGMEWRVDPSCRLKMNGGNVTNPIGLQIQIVKVLSDLD